MADDDESAYSSFDDLLPDRLKNKLVFKPMNPGPFRLINMNPSAIAQLSPMNLSPTKDYKQDAQSANAKLSNIILPPSQILKNASIVNEINKFDMTKRFPRRQKKQKKATDIMMEFMDDKKNNNGEKNAKDTDVVDDDLIKSDDEIEDEKQTDNEDNSDNNNNVDTTTTTATNNNSNNNNNSNIDLSPSEIAFIEPNFNGKKSGLCGIFRGIGPDGKKIAVWSVERFQKLLKSKLKLIDRKKLSISKALKETFYELHQAIGMEEKKKDTKKKRGSWINRNKKKNDEQEPMFQFNDSGVTATIVWLFKNKIICANVGDSTCVVGSEFLTEEDLEDGMKPKILAHLLSEKHDVQNNEKEINRIEKHGGVEFREQGVTFGVGTKRICYPGQNVPGLLITRILGFYDGKELGLIPEPSIYQMDYGPSKHKNIGYRDDDDFIKIKTLIIATPGLWDVIGPFEAIQDILLECRDRKEANPARYLLSKAYKRRSIKDISCIVLKIGWGGGGEDELPQQQQQQLDDL